jgi:hypothetical protein
VPDPATKAAIVTINVRQIGREFAATPAARRGFANAVVAAPDRFGVLDTNPRMKALRKKVGLPV